MKVQRGLIQIIRIDNKHFFINTSAFPVHQNGSFLAKMWAFFLLCVAYNSLLLDCSQANYSSLMHLFGHYGERSLEPGLD